VRARRKIVARIRRQRWLLAERGTIAGVLRAYRAALRSPRTAIIATLLLPLVVLDVVRKRPPGEPDPTPRPIRIAYTVRALNALHVFVRKMARRPRVLAYTWGFQRLAARAMAEARPALYHCNDIHTIWTGIMAARRHRAPFIYDAHEIYAHQHLVRRTLRRRAFVAVVEWIGLRRAGAALTVNDSLADWYAARYRVARPTVVRNIPDPRHAIMDVEVPPVLLSGRTTLLYIGGITTGRGLEASIEALLHLPDVDLALLGPVSAPRMLPQITSTIERLGLNDRVHFLGAVHPDAVPTIAAHATVGLALIENVCLSYYYSLPNKLFECIHAGLPVVASDFPEIRRIVEAYGVGTLCDPADPKAIAAAAAALIDDPALRARAIEGTRRAAAELRWEFEAAHLVETYRSLIGASA
jgi:glycosyltransferase involved in cell wall biosynthesis